MKHVIKRIIMDFHTQPLPAFKPRRLDVPLNLGKIITIIGPRRAGKTWRNDLGDGDVVNL